MPASFLKILAGLVGTGAGRLAGDLHDRYETRSSDDPAPPRSAYSILATVTPPGFRLNDL
jgi:hypothetical protein